MPLPRSTSRTAISSIGREPPTDVPYVVGANMLFRRAVIEQVGLYDPSLRIAEDFDLCVRARQAGWRVVFEPKAVSEHRHPPLHGRQLFALPVQDWPLWLPLSPEAPRRRPVRPVVSHHTRTGRVARPGVRDAAARSDRDKERGGRSDPPAPLVPPAYRARTMLGRCRCHPGPGTHGGEQVSSLAQPRQPRALCACHATLQSTNSSFLQDSIGSLLPVLLGSRR